MRSFFEACHGHADGPLSCTGGWVNELQKDEYGEDLKSYVALLGWKPVEHHLAFRGAAYFKSLIKEMVPPKNLKKIDEVHVRLTEIQ
jgi:hypothetical protein